MKIIHPNNETTAAIGFIDLGTMLIPRAELAKVLPDIARFERCLPTARYVSDYMSEHDGALPPGWNPTDAECKDVVLTMRELGNIELSALNELKEERKRRNGS